MKTLSTLSTLLLSTLVSAQCTFTPTVSPSGLILCPFEEAALSTETYDSYQWYRDGEAIDGATAQTLAVSSEDGGASFSVEATLDGCTEMSAAELVDGWVFLLPYVIHAGDEALYISGEGIQHNCEGDSVLLVFSYTENVQWFRNGAEISGGTNDTLLVMADGFYTAEGAPTTCPDFVMQLGVEVGVMFDEPVQPTISATGAGELCAEPEGDAYQWYLNGAPLEEDQACIQANAEGSYTVMVTYDPDCSIPSAPYLSTGLGLEDGLDQTRLFPVPAKDQVTVHWSTSDQRNTWELVDVVGRRVLEGRHDGTATHVIDLSRVPVGRYWLRSAGERPLVLEVVR